MGDPSATELLAWLGPKAGDAIPALKDALSSEPIASSCLRGGRARPRVEPGADQAIPVLIEGLEHLKDRNLNVADLPRAAHSAQEPRRRCRSYCGSRRNETHSRIS